MKVVNRKDEKCFLNGVEIEPKLRGQQVMIPL